MFDTTTIDTTTPGAIRARFLMVGDMIAAQSDPDALLVLEGPSGVIRVKYEPTITYAYGYVPCVDILAENEFGGSGLVVIPADELVTHYGRVV